MCSNCPQPKFFSTGEFDASTLTPAECVQIFQCIIDSGSQTQFTQFINEANWSTLNATQAAALCSVLPGYTVNAGTTADTTDDALGTGTVDCGDVLHFWSSDGSVLFTVADGSAIVDIRVNPAILGTGGAHTVITNIDLQPTGNPNEFTVDLEWTDSNGDTQTTVDGTPITITVPTADDLTCLVPNGPSAPLTAATGTLPDGTTYAVTGGNSSAYGTLQPGDVNWTGEITLTFSQPVNLILSPTASGDPAINNPLTWTYQNGTSPTNPSSTRLVSDGQDLVYTPGAVDAQLAIRTLAVDGVAQANGGLPDSSGLTATQDWGKLEAPAGTVYTLRARQTDAMNITAQPLAERTVCESLTELYSLVEAAGMVDDPASTELGNLIVEGDDGEEYALPLKSEQCLIETGPSAPVAGVTANNMTGDLDDDDFFNAEFENTTGVDVTVTSLVLTLGLWSNPTAVDITGTFGASTGSVSVSANPGGDVEIVFGTPLLVPANSTINGAVYASAFGTPKPVTAAVAQAASEIRHTVRTYSDGETDKVIEFDTAGDPQEITIDPAWTPCSPFDETETAAIQQIVDAKPDLWTKNVECFSNNVGVDQIEVIDNGGIPIADAAMTWTPATSGTGDIILRPDEVGQPPTLAYTIDLEIRADGLLETVLTADVQGGGFDTVNFGSHTFTAGVVYTFTPSTATPDVNIFDTLNSTQPAPQVSFVTVPASGSIPVIRIAIEGDDRYTVATLSDGSQVACDVNGDEVPVDADWIPCPDPSETALQTIEDLIEEATTCCALDYDNLTEYSVFSRVRRVGVIGTMNDIGSFTLTPLAQGDVVTQRVDFIGPCGLIPVDIDVERISAIGQGSVTIITANSVISHADNGDFRVTATVVPVDGVQPALDWKITPASYAGGAERLQFQTQYPDDYIAGPSAPNQASWDNQTGPWNGTVPQGWSNGNNGIASGFRFDGLASFTYDSYQNDNLSDSLGLELLTGPGEKQIEICEAVNDLRNEVAASSAPEETFTSETAAAYVIDADDLGTGTGHRTIQVTNGLAPIPAGVFNANAGTESSVTIINRTGAPLTISGDAGVTLISNGKLTIEQGEAIELLSTLITDEVIVIGGTS